jgi:leader peptidase (prepilin peptidase)/N-methyltransferase
LILSGFIGAVFVSLINVGVTGEKDFYPNISKPKSRCPNCEKKLVWWELIPIFSWLFLRGKCSECSKPIPKYHLISELTIFIIFSLSFVIFNENLTTLLSFWGLILMGYFFSAYDISKGIVPNLYLFPTIIFAVVFRISQTIFGSISISQFGVFVLSGLFYAIFFLLINFLTVSGLFPGVKEGQQGFGLGDAKYAFLLGLILGPRLSAVSLVLAVLLGAFFGVLFSAVSKKRIKTIPFVPFLSAALLIAVIYGNDLLEYYQRLVF